jgi:hypothetical protein
MKIVILKYYSLLLFVIFIYSCNKSIINADYNEEGYKVEQNILRFKDNKAFENYLQKVTDLKASALLVEQEKQNYKSYMSKFEGTLKEY